MISTDNFIIATTPDVDESKAVKHGKILNGYRSELTIQYRYFLFYNQWFSYYITVHKPMAWDV